MEFCPKCGSVLMQKKKNDGCARCGYSAKGKTKLKISEKTNVDGKKEIAVVKQSDTEVLPEISAACKKCGHNKALFWTVQTRSGDEAETKFFKCVKCSYTWREYR